MDIETMKKTAVEFLGNVSAQRIEKIPPYMAEDAAWWDLASRKWQTRQQLLDSLRQINQLTPSGIQIDIKRVMAEGKLVVIELESGARLTNGRTYENCVVVLIEFNTDDKVVRVKEYLDPRSLASAFDLH